MVGDTTGRAEEMMTTCRRMAHRRTDVRALHRFHDGEIASSLPVLREPKDEMRDEDVDFLGAKYWGCPDWAKSF